MKTKKHGASIVINGNFIIYTDLCLIQPNHVQYIPINMLWMEEILHHLGWDVQNPVNNGINYLSSGAEFLPSTVLPLLHNHHILKTTSSENLAKLDSSGPGTERKKSPADTLFAEGTF